MQHKTTRIAAIALVALAVLLAITALLIGKRGAAPAPATTTSATRATEAAIPVVVTKRAVAAGARLQAEDLSVERRARAPAGSYEDASPLVGQFPLRDLAAGSTVYGNDIARGVSLQLRSGERAIAVAVDELTGAGHRILPGEMVDVFLSLQGARGEEGQSQARLLLPRLRVLSYGSEDVPQPGAPRQEAEGEGAARSDRDDDTRTAGSDSRSESNSRRSNPESRSSSTSSSATRSAVLAVPIADANRLLLGAQRGKLFLALRHPGDESAPDPELFPQPRPVLVAQNNLGSDQRTALALPDNQAYAGIDLEGLSGTNNRNEPRIRAQASPSAPRAPAVEIIRGH